MKKTGITALVLAAVVAVSTMFTGCIFESMRTLKVINDTSDSTKIASVTMKDATGAAVLEDYDFERTETSGIFSTTDSGIRSGATGEATYYGSGKYTVIVTIDDSSKTKVQCEVNIPEDATIIATVRLTGSSYSGYTLTDETVQPDSAE